MTTETRKLAAILAADVVGFSRLTGADEDRTLARLRALRSDLIDPTIAVHKGRTVKRTGDGAIVEFRSVVDAVRCALEVQNAMAERNSGVPENKRIEFRMGVHLGDVVEESDGDLMGDGVNIAARLEGVAKPGAICLSEDAYRQVKSRLDLNVSDLGAMALKNISEPVRAYSVEVGKPGAKPKPPPQSRLIQAVAAVAALIVVSGAVAAAWYLAPAKTAAVVASSGLPAAGFDIPTVAILPFANATGNPQFDPLTQRIAQKTRDAAGNTTIWRIIGRPGGAAGSAADPIDAGRQLNADYVVTGNVEAGGDALHVTFQLDDVHSGARLWSQTISPVLENPNTAAAEAEVTRRAEARLRNAILDAERARLSSAGDIEKTTWGCVVKGFAANTRPDVAAGARKCLEAAAEREPSNANVWGALADVIQNQRVWGWGLPPEEASVENRSHLADRVLQAGLRAQDLAPLDPLTQLRVAMGYYATCQPERVLVEAEKAAALAPYDANVFGALGLWVAFTGHWDEGTAYAEKAIKLAGPSALPYWWWPSAKRHWFRGEYPEAYEAFQRAYSESFWLSHLDLAYTLPFLGRVDEAKQHVAALLKMVPTMTIREADAFYKLVCFDAAYREKMGGALRQAGLPE
ncbi:MAG: adenylate/guanylate cyclase domain-containing protein [Roseiarcus sp.]